MGRGKRWWSWRNTSSEDSDVISCGSTGPRIAVLVTEEELAHYNSYDAQHELLNAPTSGKTIITDPEKLP